MIPGIIVTRGIVTVITTMWHDVRLTRDKFFYFLKKLRKFKKIQKIQELTCKIPFNIITAPLMEKT